MVAQAERPRRSKLNRRNNPRYSHIHPYSSGEATAAIHQNEGNGCGLKFCNLCIARNGNPPINTIVARDLPGVCYSYGFWGI
jgi:hypothetical protein